MKAISFHSSSNAYPSCSILSPKIWIFVKQRGYASLSAIKWNAFSTSSLHLGHLASSSTPSKQRWYLRWQRPVNIPTSSLRCPLLRLRKSLIFLMNMPLMNILRPRQHAAQSLFKLYSNYLLINVREHPSMNGVEIIFSHQ